MRGYEALLKQREELRFIWFTPVTNLRCVIVLLKTIETRSSFIYWIKTPLILRISLMNYRKKQE